jgi:MurNAc alpha-1-phosphate uridylyltransferase
MTPPDRPVVLPRQAMVLAAGLGTRMRPLTDTRPKPLVTVAGTALIDHLLDRLAQAGVADAVVNIHHFAEQMEAHLKDRAAPRISLSDERDGLLDSGGGVKKALPRLGSAPFFLLNADSFWIDGPRSNLLRLAEFWDAGRMDVLLLVSAMSTATGYDGQGDFTMGPLGELQRRKERSLAPFVYAGVAILSPAIFADAPEGAFSLNRLFDRAAEAGRLFGLRLDGHWLHVGTPGAIGEAERRIALSVV